MAKQRYVNTKFWDDNYIVDKDPIEKLIFLYFLTNPLTNISGIYEISLRRISFDTGIDKEMVLKILNRFHKDDKIMYKNGWIAIKNFIKHQAVNPKIQKGIEVELDNAPREMVEWSKKEPDIAYQSLSKPLNYSNTNINNNTNTNTNTNININSNTNDDIVDELFNVFWDTYDKKIDHAKCLSKWKKLTMRDKDFIIAYLPSYIKATPDKQFRKNPATFLNNRSWENEIIEKPRELKGNESVIESFLNNLPEDQK